MTDDKLELLLRQTGDTLRTDCRRPYFATRVMAVLEDRTARSEDFSDAMAWAFRRVAIAGLGLVLALVMLNAALHGVPARSTLDMVFSMPSMTVDNAWEMETSEISQR